MNPSAPPILAMILRLENTGWGWPALLAVTLAVLAVIAAYLLGLRDTAAKPALRWLLLSLRIGAILCLLFALGHPLLVRPQPSTRLPVLAVVLDDSQSMSLPASERLSRYQQAVALLRSHLLPAAGRRVDLRLYDITGRSLDPPRLPASAGNDASPILPTLLNIQRQLRHAPDARMLLISDGIDTSLTSDDAGDSLLAQLRLSVSAVPVGAATISDTARPDLAIEAVAAGRRALVGNTVRVNVDIASVGGPVPEQSLSLAILDGDRPVAARTIPRPTGSSPSRATIEFAPTRPGQFTYTVQLGSVEGETHLANNRATFPLIVRAKALTVLSIDGVLRWEGKFLRQALGEDPDLNVIAAVRTRAPGNDRGSPGLLLTEQLGNVDAVILGDVEATYFSAREIEALKLWVTRTGGGLIVTGGYRSFGPEGLARTSLSDILPVEPSPGGDNQIERPFTLKLTPAGQDSPIFHLTGDRTRDLAFYQALPALDGCVRLARLKPGAEVLAVNPQAAGPEAAAAMPVLVTQQAGLGRVLTLTADTTWRWRQIVGGYTGDTSFYQRFWSQMVRYVARAQDDAPGRALSLTTDQDRYRTGQTIEVSAQLPSGSTNGNSPGAQRLFLTALHESGKRLPIPVAEIGPGRWRATMAAADPGRWDIIAVVQSSDASAANNDAAQSVVRTLTVDRPDVEMIQTRTDSRFLARLSQTTGGKTLAPDDLPALLDSLPAPTPELTRTTTTALWRHPLLISLFLALLCTEWLVRRWHRLA